MLKLKNLSKFYYSKGVIASGINKVNIEFNIGEFVAIIGESGSGKSTLLNVISGLDSYEEGEMYINGEETSHYRECDFEEYRKKYVSNIFQNFNLVNSYTVYQNIELVLLLNGYRKKDVKKKVLELIDKVGLTKYKRTKVSKLSGGQQQRVAIARALAKETPIIVCDEPTGNLDSRSAKGIINLLKEISKDKLVIVVTHNFSEIEDLATRVVKMHDGKIVSDKKIIETEKVENNIIPDSKSIGIFNMIRLGVRNTFNIIPKFLLIFIVFLFVTVSLLTVYGAFQKDEYEEGKLGANYYFNDTRDTRIVINKKDGSVITKEDFDKIREIDNVDTLIENDILLDSDVWFESIDDSYFGVSGYLKDISTFSGKLNYGRMPEEDNEAILLAEPFDYYFTDQVEEAVKKTYYFNGDKNDISIKVVGVKYIDEGAYSLNFNGNSIYVNNNILNKYVRNINRSRSIVKVNINNKNYDSYIDSGTVFDVRVSNRVPKGYAYVSENMSYACKDFECKNRDLSVSVSNLYYTDKITLKINTVYTEKNVNSLLGIKKDDIGYDAIFISPEDYDKLFNKESYQASVIADNVKNVDSVSNELDNLGYNTLQIRHTLANLGGDVLKILKIVKLVVIIILVVALFFISYFVIKLILKSRNVYFSTLRILGANYGHIKRILDIELFTNASLAYGVYVLIMMLVKHKVLYIKYIYNILEYLKLRDYILVYIILVVMSYFISTRFASKIFKKSAMNSYREEV